MKIALGADHGGYHLKAEIAAFIQELGHEVKDYGSFDGEAVDYPDYAGQVSRSVVSGESDRGILVCGTGIGMSIAANKHVGIRCALVHDAFSAKATREHNDSNVLAMGERVIGAGVALDIVRIWLDTAFSQASRHVGRIAKVSALEADGAQNSSC